MDCQYVATQRGGVALVFEGHRYNKVRDGKDGTVYWRCSRDRQCPGRAVTVHSRIKKANNKHNHNPDNGISAKPLLNSNSILSNHTSGSNHQNSLAAFDVAALLRNSNSNNHHLLNNLTNNNHLANHSSNHQNSLHNSSTSKQQNLTEAAMAALLSTNLSNSPLSSKDFNSANAALAALLQHQQKHSFNSTNSISNNSQQNNHNKSNDYLTNHLNDRLNAQQSDKDNQQFRDNLLSTGSTNYLSNASSSSASSSPLINLCNGQTPFQNQSKFNNNFNNKSSDLYNQFNSTNHLNSFPFMDQLNKNNQNKLLNSSSKSSNLPSALSYLNNLNSYNNLARLGQQDWLNKMSNQMNNQTNQLNNNNQQSSPLNRLNSNGQLNQLFSQFELERMGRNEQLSQLNSNFLSFNGDESSNKKFKPNNEKHELKLNEKDTKQLNGLKRRNDEYDDEKLNNDENKKEDNDMKDDFEFDEEDEIENDNQNDEIDEKLLNSSNLTDSTSVLELIKLGRFLNNPTAIFETLNQLSLNNPQMASAFAISLLGQLEQQQNSNLQSAATAESNLEANLERKEHKETGNHLQTSQLSSRIKSPNSSADETNEKKKLKTIGQFVF